jgi:hypothetical protein
MTPDQLVVFTVESIDSALLKLESEVEPLPSAEA